MTCPGCVPCLSPNDSWDRLQCPRDPELDEAGIENWWMDTHNENKYLNESENVYFNSAISQRTIFNLLKKTFVS